MRRRLLAGALTVLLLGVAACAGPAGSTATGGARVEAARDLAAVAERLDLLSQRIGGTPRQRTAGEVLQYHAYQDPVRRCMAAAGHRYEPPPFVDPYRGRTVIHMGLGTGWWLAPLGGERLGVTDTAELAGPDPEQRPSAPADQESFQSALSGCIPVATPEVNFPPAYGPLAERFDRMVGSVSHDRRVRAAGAGYPDCMARGGFPVGNQPELFELISGRRGDARPPAPGTPPDARWAALVAEERAAARRDAECRRPAWQAALRAVAPELAEFERSRRDDLEAVGRQWDEMVRQAAAHPEFPAG
ncbi:hypothetical protein [Micromonospora maritima]|uniref:Lipoprotein n=1 Tax=Micromonospora maritima TaxID=986711 RepID=A0ABW7ZI41_9ACTN